MFLRFAFALSLIFSSALGCGKLQNALDGAQKNLEKTSEGLRLQVLNEAQKNMLSPDNRHQLFPVPTGVMASAVKFGEAATTYELVALTNLWLTRIDKIERLPKFDLNGNSIPLTPEEQYEDLLERYQVLQALSAIAGQAPQGKVEAIAAEYIKTPSQFHRTSALNFIMLRAYFLRSVMIGERHLSHDFSGSGEARMAIESQRNVDWIMDQPFAPALWVKTRGLKTPPAYTHIQNLDLKMDDATRLWLIEPWDQIVLQLEQYMKVGVRNDTGDPAADAANYEAEQQEVEALLKEAKAAQEKWTKLPRVP